MKKLGELLVGFPKDAHSRLSTEDRHLEVSSVTSDSRLVQPGSVFVAVRGTSQDGHEYIGTALQKGAIAIVGENPMEHELAPYVRVRDPRRALAHLAANFYEHPSHSMKMVGVTGTSGKTTTTYLIESILKSAGHRVGVIGTVNFRFGEKLYESTHTTPGAVELQKLLAQMKSDQCTAVVMEVSSHALKQRRVDAIAFDAMDFHNLSREHLDFHPDMEDYFQSKAILFKELAPYAVEVGKKPVATVNVDDEFGKRLAKELTKGGPHLLEYRWEEGLRVGLDGIHGKVRGKAGELSVDSDLIGKFNGYNVLAAIRIAQGLGIDSKKIEKGISSLKAVPGRVERVPNSKGVHVLVDYAHKPDALEKVLRTLQEVRGENRLITVFGCGGDRDRTKRPVMGKIAVELSDHVFITSDNPRTEDPNAIIQEILTGVEGHKNYSVEADRKKAIFAAAKFAHQGDMILIAGKGHEDYQILGKTKVHFDDREVAAEALS